VQHKQLKRACPSSKLQRRLTDTRCGFVVPPCVNELVEEGHLLKLRRRIGRQRSGRAVALPRGPKPRAGRDRGPTLRHPCPSPRAQGWNNSGARVLYTYFLSNGPRRSCYALSGTERVVREHRRGQASATERQRPRALAAASCRVGASGGRPAHLRHSSGRCRLPSSHLAMPGASTAPLGHGPAAALMAARWFAVLRPRLAAVRPRSAAMAHRPPPVSRLLSSGGSSPSPSPTDVLAAELARLADLPRAQFLAGLAQTTDVVTGGMPQVFLLAAAASSHLSVPR